MGNEDGGTYWVDKGVLKVDVLGTLSLMEAFPQTYPIFCEYIASGSSVSCDEGAGSMYKLTQDAEMSAITTLLESIGIKDN